MYRNSEGYADPTAGAAMGRVRSADRKEKSDRRKAQRKKNAHARKERTLSYRDCQKVYVVSPYAGDTRNNIPNAIRYCQHVITQGRMPIASHLLYPQMLNDNNPRERELGLLFGLALLAICDEVWVFGTNVSAGMEKEIEEARQLGKPLRFMEEVL